GALLLAAAASAQPTAPLEARLFFPTPPPNSTFDTTTPIKISLQIRNVSGANVITIDGFSATDFWRRVYFALEGFGIITKADAAGAIITNCDIEFGAKSVLSTGDAGSVGRQQFEIVSNSLEFVISGDLVAPTTTVAQSPAANAAGWSKQDVTLAFTAADNAGG